MYAFVMAVLRGAGDSKTPFYFMLLSVAIDIALNPVLIFGVGPIPRLGIAGSALATFVAQAVSLTALIRHLYRRRHILCLHKEELRLLRVDWSVVGTLVKKGIPMSAQMLVVSLSAVLMITLVNRFGVDTTAAFGAALQIWNYIQMPAFAVGMAVSAMTAQNVGARKWERVPRIAWVGVAYSVLLTGSVVLAIELLNTRVFGLFLPAGSAALSIATQMNRVVTGSFIFFGVSVALFGVVRATGAVIAPLIILTISLLVVRFPLAELFLDRYRVGGGVVEFPGFFRAVVPAGAALLQVRRLAQRPHVGRHCGRRGRALPLSEYSSPAAAGRRMNAGSTGATECRTASWAGTARASPRSVSAAWA